MATTKAFLSDGIGRSNRNSAGLLPAWVREQRESESAIREAKRILSVTEPGSDPSKAFGAVDWKAWHADVSHAPVTYRATDQTLTPEYAALAESLSSFLSSEVR